MKRMNFTMGALLVLMATACAGNKTAGSQDGVAGDDSAMALPESDTLVFENVSWTDTIAYKVKIVDYSSDEDPAPYTIETATDSYSFSTLKVVAGKPEVVKFINQWLTLDAARELDCDPSTAEDVAKKYAELKKRDVTDVHSAMKSSSKEYLGDRSGADGEDEEALDEMPFASGNEYESSITFMWQTPALLTLWDSGYDYSAGAAHGMPWGFARTFDLKNLRILKYDDILKPESHEAVLKLVVADLVDEYSDSGMMNEPDEIDLPSSHPALVAEGVRFDYGAYEIGAYALGMPEVVIPYEKMKPYLTDKVKELLEIR